MALRCDGSHCTEPDRSIDSGPYPSFSAASGSSTIRVEGSVFCACGQRALKITSKIWANPDRDFYRCPFWRCEGKSCGYFQWADELKTTGGATTTSDVDMYMNNRLCRRVETLERQVKRIVRACVVLYVLVIILSVAIAF